MNKFLNFIQSSFFYFHRNKKADCERPLLIRLNDTFKKALSF
ncbi:hypothetical protein CHCC20335_3396 [Bacillus paralicheniformis]|nr:hypothetical protein CHCC20335_3396 [Bacillus paralicheniformis]